MGGPLPRREADECARPLPIGWHPCPGKESNLEHPQNSARTPTPSIVTQGGGSLQRLLSWLSGWDWDCAFALRI